MIKKIIASWFVALLLNASVAKAQKETDQTVLNGEYINKGGMCSASFSFKSNGEFYYEGGCEERSSIAKGRYELSQGKLALKQDTPVLLYTIAQNKISENGKVLLTLIDKEGKPLTFFNVFTLPQGKIRDTLSSVIHNRSDAKGEIMFDLHSIAFISFDRFNPSRIDKTNQFKWEPVSINNGTSMTVQFNYPGFCLRYPEINMTKGLPVLKRVLPDDVLIDGNSNIYERRRD